MIIAIDGPAGSGKSSASRALAKSLGFRFLDTGAMYRTVAYAALQQQLDFNDPVTLERLASDLKIELQGDRVLLDGQDISDAIRTPEVTAAVRHVADNLQVRATLSKRQREFARHGDLVTEGRDQATVVFPDAECKIYLTASPDERARRRHAELVAKGLETTVEETKQQLLERDQQDANRPVGGLQQADDAIVVSTDGMTAEEVLDALIELVQSKSVNGG